MVLWISKNWFCIVVQQIYSQSSCNYGNQCVLLQLVLKYWCLWFAVWTYTLTLQRIFHRYVYHCLQCTHSHRGNTKSSRKQSLGHFEESLLNSFDFMLKLSVFTDITVSIHEVLYRNSHIMKFKSSIVYSIESNLVSHIMNLNMGVRNKVFISDWDQKSIYPLVLSFYYGLSKNQCLICMNSSICYPILLGLYCWRVYYKLLSCLVICCCCFHHYCVITIAEFCQTKTASYFKSINLIENVFMSLRM